MLVRYFDSFNSYYSFYRSGPERSDVVDIVRYTNATVADAVFTCKSWKTAIKRLADASGWSWVLGELECADHRTMFLDDCDSVIIESVGDNLWYVAAKQYD